MALRRDLADFDAFWPVYLREHTRLSCRVVHYLAATSVVTLVTLAVTLERYSLLFAVPLAAYGLAWTGHFVFEKNRPATWVYPWWSLRAEWRMCTLAMFGRLEPHLDRHLPGRGADAPED